MRSCSGCAVEKPATEFNARQSKCKDCQRKYRQEWYLANREHMLALSKRWHAANREKRREIARRYARNHPETNSKWQRENPEAKRRVAREWARRNLEKVEDHTRNRRARIRGAFVEKVEIAKVRERDAGRCGICGEIVAPENESLDHILPLARGGEHSYANTQLAHLSCNKRKNDLRGSM